MRGLWQAIHRLLAVLKPSWFAVVIVAAISLVLQVSQTRDVLNEVTTKDGVLLWQHLLFVFLSLVTFSICSWFFPRALLSVRYWNTSAPNSPQEAQRFEQYRRWAPRVLGVMPIISLAIAYFRADQKLFSLLYGLTAVGFMTFVILRRRLYLRGETIRAEVPHLLPTTFKVLIGLLSVSYLLLLLFLFFPVAVPRFIGSVAIVLYAGAAWVAFGSFVLIYPTYRYQLPPLVLVLFLLAAVFGLWNDNHEVRPGIAEPIVWKRERVTSHFQAWLKHREAVWDKRKNPSPVFVASAEGGGIRAAYWTASVLARLEDDNQGFACHLFAVSGVSGGSLGGAVFSALIADEIVKGNYSCDGRATKRAESLIPKVKKILGEDFLAPTLAGMLFPDLMQRFSPLYGRLAFPDRAKYLEMAWEQTWHDATGNMRFEENFQALWQPEGHRYQVPSLFLNGTWVENGERNVTSNLTPKHEKFGRLDDVLTALGEPIRLSTAVHMSARFTYVSPPGTVSGLHQTRHIVDGGYFENSGALTASEIISVIKDDPRIVPIALIISNAPNNPNNSIHNRTKALGDGGSGHQILNETLSPWRTLFNTISARGYDAERALMETQNWVRFPLGQYKEATIPLGWMLSSATQNTLDRKVDNLRPEIKKVGDLLKP